MDDYLWFKNKAEKRQEKMDRIDEQKMMRLRDRRERDERTGTVQRLLLASNQDRGAELQKQKDGEEEAAEDGGSAEAAPAEDREVWEETPDVDYEAFEQALAVGELDSETAPPPPAWMPPSAAPGLSLTSIPRDASERPVEPREYLAPFVPGMEMEQHQHAAPDTAPVTASVTAAGDGWGAIDAVVTVDPRTLHKSAAPAGTPGHAPSAEARGSMYAVLDGLGLTSMWDVFLAAGETDARALANLGTEAGPRLASLGLKLGQRQRVLNALTRM